VAEALGRQLILTDASEVAHRALAEDGEGDVTSEVTIPLALHGQGVLEVRTDTVLAGLAYAEAVALACGLGPF
jgi:nicotinate-nucleotide pyrophosphorylase